MLCTSLNKVCTYALSTFRQFQFKFKFATNTKQNNDETLESPAKEVITNVRKILNQVKNLRTLLYKVRKYSREETIK